MPMTMPINNAKKEIARPKWCIRVTFPSGVDAFLRLGGDIDRGPIATFTTRAFAEANVKGIAQGFDDSDVVTVVRYRKDFE